MLEEQKKLAGIGTNNVPTRKRNHDSMSGSNIAGPVALTEPLTELACRSPKTRFWREICETKIQSRDETECRAESCSRHGHIPCRCRSCVHLNYLIQPYGAVGDCFGELSLLVVDCDLDPRGIIVASFVRRPLIIAPLSVTKCNAQTTSVADLIYKNLL